MTSPEGIPQPPDTLMTTEKARKLLEDKILWYEYADPQEIDPMDTMFYEMDKQTLADPEKLEEFVISTNKVQFDSVLQSAGETDFTLGTAEPYSPESPGQIDGE